MYVLIEEWIPGVPTRLLGTTVEDIPVDGERIVKADACNPWPGVKTLLHREVELRNKDPAEMNKT